MQASWPGPALPGSPNVERRNRVEKKGGYWVGWLGFGWLASSVSNDEAVSRGQREGTAVDSIERRLHLKARFRL